jgi:hypothetical protein
MPAAHHVYRFTINWQPTIARLVRSVNTLTQIAVSGPGFASGGVVIFTERIILSFVRTDGEIRHVTVGGVLHEVVVGHPPAGGYKRPSAASGGSSRIRTLPSYPRMLLI